MKPITTSHRQRGVTLIVGLIMLVLITLMVTTAFVLSNTNLKSVGNMQYRSEVIAAANVAIERVVSVDFTTPAVLATYPQDFSVDIDNDGTNEYSIHVLRPVCVKATAIMSLPPSDPDALTCAFGIGGAPLCYDTVWEIESSVNATGFAALTGAAATVKQGISKRVDTSKIGVCS